MENNILHRILITGANKGIGFASVSAVLGQSVYTQVLLGSRSLVRGQQARACLVASNPHWEKRLDVVEIDVSNDESVAHAAGDLLRRYQEDTPLFAVVNNAGVGPGAADLEPTLEVNTRGVRRVCEGFLPLLDPQRGRIVNVTSASGPMFVAGASEPRQRFFVNPEIQWAKLDEFMDECVACEDLHAFESLGLRNGDPYGLSKACANSYTQIVARENPSLLINACTPGFIETDMTRPLAQAQGKTPSDMGMKLPAQGTQATVHLLFAELEGSGHFYGSDAVRSPLHQYRAPGAPPYNGE
jgi:NAD(P)-dependent dehydrogenase (short-subunit alcohol dehydrogenase family)